MAKCPLSERTVRLALPWQPPSAPDGDLARRVPARDHVQHRVKRVQGRNSREELARHSHVRPLARGRAAGEEVHAARLLHATDDESVIVFRVPFGVQNGARKGTVHKGLLAQVGLLGGPRGSPRVDFGTIFDDVWEPFGVCLVTFCEGFRACSLMVSHGFLMFLALMSAWLLH